MDGILESFAISPNCFIKKSETLFNCLVPEKWLKTLNSKQCNFVPKIPSNTYENVDKCLAELCLARCTSNQTLDGFTRVSVQVVEKKDVFVESLIETPLSIGSEACHVNAKIKCHMDEQYKSALHLSNISRYKYAVQHNSCKREIKKLKHHDVLMYEALTRLYANSPLPTYNNYYTANFKEYNIDDNITNFYKNKQNYTMNNEEENVSTNFFNRNRFFKDQKLDMSFSKILQESVDFQTNTHLNNPKNSPSNTPLLSKSPLQLYNTYQPPSKPTQHTFNTPQPPDNKPQSPFKSTHPLILPVYFTCESSKAFYIFRPLHKFTLADLVVFSPERISNPHCQYFLVYQILTVIQQLNLMGFNVDGMQLTDFTVDDQLVVRLKNINFQAFYREAKLVNLSTINIEKSLNFNISLYNLPHITQRWAYREVSNLDYLLILNRLAGREEQEPNHHIILPWVLDFSGLPSNKIKLRDLTKSKYRLNKGEEQLDLTFDSSTPDARMTQTPFHVSDFLSDISYYVYIARNTPRDVLCKIVRPRWQPNHYPMSVERLYEWTPDECIPAFFLHPSVFESCHQDLTDLQLPLWATSASHFTKVHLSVLESDEVSLSLHHWIDLTFGYKLSGLAAIKSKNVCLQLVDKHKTLNNHGVVQLFTQPHPARKTNGFKHKNEEFKDLLCTDGDKGVNFDLDSIERSSQTHINMNGEETTDSNIRVKNIENTLKELEDLEKLYNFCLSTTGSLDANFGKTFQEMAKGQEHYQEIGLELSLKSRDMITLGCILVELLFSSIRSKLNSENVVLENRFLVARAFLSNQQHQLTYFTKKCLNYLFNINPDGSDVPSETYTSSFDLPLTYPLMHATFDLPSPSIDIITSSVISILPLSSHFYHFFRSVISCIPDVLYNSQSNKIEIYNPNSEFFGTMDVTLKRIHQSGNRADVEMVHNIFLPFVKHFVSGEAGNDVAVNTMYHLYFILYKILGHKVMLTHFLKPTLHIFKCEIISTEFVKIYNKSFVSTLMEIFKMDIFLNNFSIPLVEAVSGFKDFELTDEKMKKSEEKDDENLVDKKEPEKIFDDVIEKNLEESSPVIPIEAHKITKKMEEELDEVYNVSNNNMNIGDEIDFYTAGGFLLDEDTEELTDRRSCENLDPNTENEGISGDEFKDKDYITEKEDLNSIPINAETTSMITLQPSYPIYSRLNSFRRSKSRSSFVINNQCSPMYNFSSGYNTPSFTDDSIYQDKNHHLAKEFDQNLFSINTETSTNNKIFSDFSKMPQISEITSDTLKWLTEELGPVLAVKHLSQNLLRMLALCYMPLQQVLVSSESNLQLSFELATSKKYVTGDINAKKILSNLQHISSFYGQQVITIHFFKYIEDFISSSIQETNKQITSKSEGCIISSLTLLLAILKQLPIHTIMDFLPKITEGMLHPIMKLTSSLEVTFTNNIHTTCAYQQHGVKIDSRSGVTDTIGNDGSVNKDVSKSGEVFHRASGEDNDKITRDKTPGNTMATTAIGDVGGEGRKDITVRSILAYRCFEVASLLSHLIGFEMTRLELLDTIKILFEGFAIVKNITEQPPANHGLVAGTFLEHCEEPVKGHSKNHSIDEVFGMQESLSKPSQESSSKPFQESLSSPSQFTKVPYNDTGDKIRDDVLNTYNAEFAHHTYVTFCKQAGGIFMESILEYNDHIRELSCAYDEARVDDDNKTITTDKMYSGQLSDDSVVSEKRGMLYSLQSEIDVSKPEEATSANKTIENQRKTFHNNIYKSNDKVTKRDEDISNKLNDKITHKDKDKSRDINNYIKEYSDDDDYDNVSIEGNKIVVRSTSGVVQRVDRCKSANYESVSKEEHDLSGGQRHLRGDWLSYWEHEIGLSSFQQDFNVKQIKLQVFKGHTAGVKSIISMNNEGSFLSASKDKTVKLWSIRNQGMGTHESFSEDTYRGHRKGVVSMSYLSCRGMVVSSDLNVHLWDAESFSVIRKWDVQRLPPTSHLLALPPDQACFLAASTFDPVIRFIDVRSQKLSHHFKSTILSTGQVRSIALSEEGTYLAVAFNSGFISTLDLRTGTYLGSWKAHDSEVHEMQVIGDKLVTSGLDTCISLWNFPSGKHISAYKASTENHHCLHTCGHTLISTNLSQRVYFHSLFNFSKNNTVVKLKSDLYRGNLTCLTSLPLNHLFLVASDNGDITLIT